MVCMCAPFTSDACTVSQPPTARMHPCSPPSAEKDGKLGAILVQRCASGETKGKLRMFAVVVEVSMPQRNSPETKAAMKALVS